MEIITDDDTLGMKHQKYNKLVQNAIANNKQNSEKQFIPDMHDLDNLMKIDIASHNKDIDYILSVLKSEDMLYVLRAIKQCTWLVDDQYENIINPEYLNEELFPQMTSKASTKLFKHIRQHLKTERRVEQFYNNETSPREAAKWLSRCSIPFIEANIGKQMRNLPNMEFKRLCEKSVSIFEVAMKNDCCPRKLKAAMFLLHTHIDKFLDVFESMNKYSRPTLSAKATKLIMKQTPDRIKQKFLKYIRCIHIPTFVNYIKREEVKNFLYELANKNIKKTNEDQFKSVFKVKVIQYFIKRLPREEQFEFVKKVFLDKETILKIEDESLIKGSEMFALKRICMAVCPSIPNYYWYEYAPFNIAFNEIKKLIVSAPHIYEKYAMLKVLLHCAGTNTKHLLTLLIYYSKNHLKDDIEQKREFVNKLLSQTEIYKNDEETWNTFIEIFINMNVYTENENQVYAEIIILYNVLQNKQVSEIIEKSFKFNTLKHFRYKLNPEEQSKVFGYLYYYTIKKLENHEINNETQFKEAIQLLNNLLDLLIDWKKQIIDYPIAISKIKDLIQIRQENSWKINLSLVYNKKKTWRRFMFEQSVVLHPSQNVCVNALKHEPGLLIRYWNDVEKLCYDDKICLKKLLRKIRIYWPESLATNWTNSYLGRLDKLEGRTALTRGLFILLPQAPILDFIKKYAPAEAKIDWSKTDELTLSLQRCIAKNMHIARPQPSADAILLYAKGDFLQYALPSLLAIYSNMSRSQSQQDIPKLLNARVSLQKHGLRLAFVKLKHEELKYHLSNIWQTSKNITIRQVTFVLLFDLMCKEKDNVKVSELWDVLEMFINNLSFQEDKKIYDQLAKVQQVPEKIKPRFLVKSYQFLKNLLPHLKNDRKNYENSIESLVVYTREIMEFMCPDFVVDIIEEFLNENFFNSNVHNLNEDMFKVISAYLMCAKDEETQSKKCDQILAPLIKRSLDNWDETQNDNYFIRLRLHSLLKCFSIDLKDYVIKNKMILPTKMFTDIQKELDKSLVISQNYIMLTMWKLVVKIIEIIEKNDEREDWDKLCSQIAPDCGKICLDILKEDVKSYFSCIYVLYSKVIDMTVLNILSKSVILQIIEGMLSDEDFIQGFLVTLKLLKNFSYCDIEKKKVSEIRNKIHDHPSVEVKMHYYNVFRDELECESC